jgi:hypothetical protein
LPKAARVNYSTVAVKSAAPLANLGPLPHRRQHGRDELASETVKETHGAPAQPFRSIDIVENLLRRGCITREMAKAADRLSESPISTPWQICQNIGRGGGGARDRLRPAALAKSELSV